MRDRITDHDDRSEFVFLSGMNFVNFITAVKDASRGVCESTVSPGSGNLDYKIIATFDLIEECNDELMKKRVTQKASP